MNVIFIKDGVETPAEVLQERDGDYRDLLVAGERVMSVPFWKRIERIGTEQGPQDVEVQRQEPCWRPA